MNPQNDNTVQRWKQNQYIAFEEASVFTVPTHTESDEVGHIVEIMSESLNEPQTAEVVTPQSGDVCLPTEGDTVIVGYRLNGRPQVVGTQYKNATNIPPFEEGERVVGHPASDSHIRFKTDGTVHIEGHGGNTVELQPDGSIVINGGSQRPVTDVETSTADGYVTDVSLTRSSDVYLP